jgi:hypothetical protein
MSSSSVKFCPTIHIHYTPLHYKQLDLFTDPINYHVSVNGAGRYYFEVAQGRQYHWDSESRCVEF